MKAILGRKVGMTQVFATDGTILPVTVIEVLPNVVMQKKTLENDGYEAVQLGYEDKKDKNANNPEKGHTAQANTAPKYFLKEVKGDEMNKYNLGDVVKVDIFQAGELVDVTAKTKGHGFTGVIKKWNQHRLKMTHGTGPVHREPGSMGPISSPSRVFKNKHLAGQYGVDNVTIQNLEIVRVDLERNAILIKGAIPGPKGSIVTIADSVKSK